VKTIRVKVTYLLLNEQNHAYATLDELAESNGIQYTTRFAEKYITIAMDAAHHRLHVLREIVKLAPENCELVLPEDFEQEVEHVTISLKNKNITTS
jgi:hypothetical protein